jgi:hypothetical protein
MLSLYVILMVKETASRRGSCDVQVGGRPASPRSVSLGLLPLSTTFGVNVPDDFLMAVMAAHQPFLQLEGRPALTKPIGLS